MEDKAIVGLFLERSEEAISQTKEKYGKYCYAVSYNILQSECDAEECVNDTYVSAWNSIPPNKPNSLSAYLGKLTRNISLNRYYYNRAMKRSPTVEVALEELEEILSADNTFDPVGEEAVLKDSINRFLGSLSAKNRIIFVRRYWYLSSVKDIANDCGMSESNVKIKLLRMRESLKAFLKKEGIQI